MTKQYQVLTATCLNTLHEDMDEYLRDGWEPQGGVAIGMSGRYIQAVTKGLNQQKSKPVKSAKKKAKKSKKIWAPHDSEWM